MTKTSALIHVSPLLQPSDMTRVWLRQVMTCEDEPAVLFPSKGGNVHQFNAISACAVLDILCPPYAPGAGAGPIPAVHPGIWGFAHDCLENPILILISILIFISILMFILVKP